MEELSAYNRPIEGSIPSAPTTTGDFMKIDLQLPYSKDWKLGYLVTNPEPRRTVVLYNSGKDRSSVSYARYLMSVKLGRYLSRQEHVDHIDNDKTNDVLENLQILTPKENSRKQGRSVAVFYECICPACGGDFKLPANQAYNKFFPTCSRSCGRKKASWTIKNRDL